MDDSQKQNRLQQLRVEILKREISKRRSANQSSGVPAQESTLSQPAKSKQNISFAQLLGSPLLAAFPQTRPAAEALGQTSLGMIEGLTGGLPRQAIEAVSDIEVPTGEGTAGTVGRIGGAIMGLPRMGGQAVIKAGSKLPIVSKLFSGKSFLQRIPSGAIEGAVASSLFPQEGEFNLDKRLDAAKVGAVTGSILNPTLGSIGSAVSKGSQSRKAIGLITRAEAFKKAGQPIPQDLADELAKVKNLASFGEESTLRIQADEAYNRAITNLRNASEKDVTTLASKWPEARSKGFKYFDKAYKTIFSKSKDVDKNDVLSVAREAREEMVGLGSQLPEGMVEKLDDFIINFGSKQSKLVDGLGRPIGGKPIMTGSDLQTLRTNLRNNLSEFGDFGTKYADKVSERVLGLLRNNLDDAGKAQLDKVRGDYKEFEAIQDFMRTRFGSFKPTTQTGAKTITPRQQASAQSIGMAAAERQTGVIPQGIFAKTSGVQSGLGSLPKATAGEIDRLNQVLNMADSTNIPKLLRTEISQLPNLATKSNVAKAAEVIRREISSLESQGAKVSAQNTVKLDRLREMEKRFGKYSSQRTGADAFAVLTKGVDGWLIFQILRKLSGQNQ